MGISIQIIKKESNSAHDLEVVKVDFQFMKQLAKDAGNSSVIKELPGLFKECPNDFLSAFAIVAANLRSKLHPGSELMPEPRIVVRIYNTEELGITALEELKSSFINKYVTIAGSVLRVSTINVLVMSMEFQCSDCRTRVRISFNNGKYDAPTTCPNPECHSKNMMPERGSAITSFFQRIRVQEIDTDLKAVSAGKMPKTVECELRDDLVDCCVSGDVVELCGVLKPELTTDDSRCKGLFSSYIDVNFLSHRNCAYNTKDLMTDITIPMSVEDIQKEHLSLEEKQIINISKRTDIIPLLVKSLCPQIYGHEMVKYGLLLTLFGGSGVSLFPTEAKRVRPDIHVLIVGDPGMGKSQILKYLVKISPRGFYICGKSTTNAGLTVAVCKDPIANEHTLEAGALVLSDQGICCIDEFDKMSSDYSTLLEAMEQQTVSVAKGGMLCSLSARCSIIASANATNGRYNPEKSILDNIKLNSAILSRFDLVFVLLDKPDAAKDKKLTEHVLKLYNKKKRTYNEISPDHPGENGLTMSVLAHRAKRMQIDRQDEDSELQEMILNMPIAQEDSKEITMSPSTATEDESLLTKIEKGIEQIGDPLSIEDMRKYVAYARQRVSPKLTPEACEEMKEFYVHMREIEGEKNAFTRNFPITTRLLESLIRLAQARAKMELRDMVTRKDAREVIELVSECLSGCAPCQGMSSMYGKNCDKGRRKRVDMNNVAELSKKKQTEVFMERLRGEAVIRGDDIFDYNDLVKISKEIRMNVGDFSDYIAELNNGSFLLLKGPQKYKLNSK